MDFSLGFLVTIFLVIFPGLLYRKLYFYGEFSKEFNSGLGLVSLLAISTIPGLIILFFSFFLFSYFFNEINLSEVINVFKDIRDPGYRHTCTPFDSLNILLEQKILPLILFQYVISFVLGIITGRVIRNLKLDTKIKALRFKNYWFYVFNGQYDGFRKLKHLKNKKQKHLFTKADILVDSNSKTLLYSGIVVDYELDHNDYCKLSKVYLQNAERYSIKDEKILPKPIPGTLLIVDCTNMININLRYVFEDTKDFLKSKIPGIVDIIYGLISIFLIPFFIYQTKFINLSVYENYFKYPWYKKVLIFFTVVQTIAIINPFIKIDNEYKYLSPIIFFVKLIFIIILWVVIWVV